MAFFFFSSSLNNNKYFHHFVRPQISISMKPTMNLLWLSDCVLCTRAFIFIMTFILVFVLVAVVASLIDVRSDLVGWKEGELQYTDVHKYSVIVYVPLHTIRGCTHSCRMSMYVYMDIGQWACVSGRYTCSDTKIQLVLFLVMFGLLFHVWSQSTYCRMESNGNDQMRKVKIKFGFFIFSAFFAVEPDTMTLRPASVWATPNRVVSHVNGIIHHAAISLFVHVRLCCRASACTVHTYPQCALEINKY